ncbi:MAG: M3 family metallopeptidase [Bacteroidales bacterium]|jgi:peptidyl-dipeptidase Dcp|nr:M3 family metallopeptidase [Bacteroidales bacterium]
MKKTILIMLGATLLFGSCGKKDNSIEENPLIMDWNTPLETPPFEKIKPSHYLPAFTYAMKEHNKEIEEIINNKEKPGFENTIVAFDNSGEILSKVSGVFFNMTEAKTSDEMAKLEEEIGPLVAKHSDEILMNEKFFERVKKVYDNRDKENLNQEQKMLLDKIYKRFVRSGALLKKDKQEELKKINEKITTLEAKFSSNVLKETKAYMLVIDNKEDLKGLPQWLVDNANATAEENGKKGKWVFTLDNPSVFPFLQYSEKRDLREKIFKAKNNRCNNGGETDNKDIIKELVYLRAKKAELLGYKTFADYVLEERMNKTPKEVFSLLEGLLEHSIPIAERDAKQLEKLLDKDEKNAKLQAWDWTYYSEILKKQKFNFDEEQTRPYFEINNVRQGCFDVIEKLYGLNFTYRKDISVYEEDVMAFEVKNEENKTVGVLYFDPFTRNSKRGGAWCTEFRGQYIKDGKNIIPLVSVCFNYAKNSKGRTTLTAEEVSTIFHEMGHAIHCLLSNCTYKSTAGTNVPMDFVELPSQVFEHWTKQPVVLKMFAKDEKGQTIPDSLLNKIEKVGSYDVGYAMSERYAAAYLDMEYHILSSKDKIEDVNLFEKKAMEKIHLPYNIPPRYRSTYFNHVFGGEYAVGYYSYVWSEVLDADAFDAFLETGDVFNKTIADKFKNEILSKGGTDDAMTLYKNFRGKAPSIDALLRNNGIK